MSVSPSSRMLHTTHSGRNGIRTHMTPVESHGLANRPGEPYPAAFRIQWTGWESNPTHRLCKSQSPPRNMPARNLKRSVRELNPAFVLTKDVCGRNTYRPYVIPDGIEPSLSWVSSRRLNRWTTGSSVTRVGIEPTESSGSRPDRFTGLRT